ncbi:MAG: rhomboid family intramembrane serine protease [Treponema sp.]|jgi:membrane associated rhomboid family serine protease|nr:rhomboid family intramembrane serine protease [Treponema sp.]
MRLKYNAPVVLTFTFISVAVLFLSTTLLPNLRETWFMIGGKGSFSLTRLQSWVTLFSHVIGHAGWEHLVSNFSMLLLVGPLLESNYGSRSLLFMMIVTALVTGILNVLLFSTGLMGASGVVFMMILLASFTNFSKGEIPLTFILVLVLYLGGQVYAAFNNVDNISQFAHIVGGFCGSLFGFIRPPRGSNGF